MGREEQTQYEQDRLGNERKKLDQLRAQEGMTGADADDEGIQRVTSTETGTSLTVYSIPTHADEAILDLIHAHNSASSSGTFTVQELQLDGNGNVTGSTRRSVPIDVGSDATRTIDYEGLPFENAIGVSSEFEGVIGFAVISDHKEFVEPGSTDT